MIVVLDTSFLMDPVGRQNVLRYQIEGIYRLLMSDYNMPVNIGNPHEITIKEFAEEITQNAKWIIGIVSDMFKCSLCTYLSFSCITITTCL